MVMTGMRKRNMMAKNLTQSILHSLGRYIAIALIIALGAGMFVGLLSTRSDMVATGQKYTDEQNMFDLRLVTSYGWGKDQVAQIAALDGIVDAEGVFYQDFIVDRTGSDQAVYRFYTMPENVNKLVLLGGRMPEGPDECLADGYRNDDSALGTQITVSDSNSSDSLDNLACRTFTIVGYVSTPLYMDMNRGSTSVGSGTIANYFYIPAEAVTADYYTEIHVTIPGQHCIYSDEYNTAMEEAADALEPALQVLADERLTDVLVQAQSKYEEGLESYRDGFREYLDGKQEAARQLSDAKKQLEDGKKQLADTEQLLKDGESQIEEGKQTLSDSKQTLAQSRKLLADTKASAYAQIADAMESLYENYQTVSSNLQQVNSGLLQVQTGLIQINSGISQLESGITQLETAISTLDTVLTVTNTGIDAAQTTLDKAQASGMDPDTVQQLQQQLDALKQKRDEYTDKIADLEAQKQSLQTQLDGLYLQRQELQDKEQELLDAQVQLQAGMDQINDGMLQLKNQRAAAEEQFAAAEAQIAAGEAQITEGEKELETRSQEIADGWTALEEGKKTLEQSEQDYSKAEKDTGEKLENARQELYDAAQALHDAKETIDSMTENPVMVLDRNTNIGYSSLESNSQIVAGVSRIFPAFFLLVAALVCITTMTRMIDEERTQIGTLKALGFTSREIISKYLIYSGSSALLGCVLGVLAGSVVFPEILWEAYKIMVFITPRIVLKLNYGLCAAVTIVYTGTMLLVTWICCRRTLQEVPAELIRPKAPAAGKRLLLERLPFWKRLGFLNKVTVRNIFQYRQRLAMMLIGIGGCTALLLTGFGIRDTIVHIVDDQFQDISLFDGQIYFREGQSEKKQADFRQELADSTQGVYFYHQESVELTVGSKTSDIYLLAADGGLCEYIRFCANGKDLDYPAENQALISSGAARSMGVRAGDSITVRSSDMQELTVTVSAVYDNYIYNYVIVAPETVESQWGSLPEQEMAVYRCGENQDPYAAGSAANGFDGVMNVTVSQELAGMIGGMMDAMNLVVLVIVFCAGLLAAVVLYNLTNINIKERLREIATIKVLGFNAWETALYVFKENLILSLMGALIGLPFGKLLLCFVVDQIRINLVWFRPRASIVSYCLSLTLTLLTALIVDGIFYFRLDKINMAEALKSVE